VRNGRRCLLDRGYGEEQALVPSRPAVVRNDMHGDVCGLRPVECVEQGGRDGFKKPRLARRS
jgi:hypothetical protein